MLLSGSQSELKRMQFAAEVDGKNQRTILSAGVLWGTLKQDSRSQMLPFSSAFIHSVISRLMETIPNHTNSCPKARGLSSKDYKPAEDKDIAIVAKRIAEPPPHL
ncbi:hypothetical protein TNCV_4536671 [Trichonephila clavipes]|nr:hypothetical protein TNCV_4536671 [Trichonephila clavipes]